MLLVSLLFVAIETPVGEPDQCSDYNSTLYEQHEEQALKGFGNRDNSSIEDFSYWMGMRIDSEYLECFSQRFSEEEYVEGTYQKGNETYILLNATGHELLNSTDRGDTSGGS